MTVSLPDTIERFIHTVNAHDADGFIASFTPDGVVDDWGRLFSSPEQISAWSDREFIGAVGTLAVTDVSHDGDDVVVIGDWRSQHANGLSSFRFTTVGNKISRMVI
ncbi:MAG: nuclear transport factor 2 family protein, partial [Mycetocola sp.]